MEEGHHSRGRRFACECSKCICDHIKDTSKTIREWNDTLQNLYVKDVKAFTEMANFFLKKGDDKPNKELEILREDIYTLWENSKQLRKNAN